MNAKLIKDKYSKKSLGYGFVKFVKFEDAQAAIESKNGFWMGYKKLKVSIARPACEEIKNCKLYITNLPKDYCEDDVIQVFQEVSAIISWHGQCPCILQSYNTLLLTPTNALIFFDSSEPSSSAVSSRSAGRSTPRASLLSNSVSNTRHSRLCRCTDIRSLVMKKEG